MAVAVAEHRPPWTVRVRLRGMGSKPRLLYTARSRLRLTSTPLEAVEGVADVDADVVMAGDAAYLAEVVEEASLITRLPLARTRRSGQDTHTAAKTDPRALLVMGTGVDFSRWNLDLYLVLGFLPPF